MVNTGRFVSLAVTLLRFDLSKDDITGIPPFLIHEMFHCCESNGMEPGKQSVVTPHHRDISRDPVLTLKKGIHRTKCLVIVLTDNNVDVIIAL